MSLVMIIFTYISSILFSFSQSYIIYTVKKKGNIGLKNTSCFSIICCLIYELIWFTNYKYKKENDNICWCYLIGACFSFIWIVFYLFYYSKENKDPKKKILYLVLYLFTIADIVAEVCYIEYDLVDNQKETLGKIIACIFNVLMYITPGLNIFNFIWEKDIGYIFIPILVIGLINCCILFTYGILNDDNKEDQKYYIYSNIAGFIVCLIQVILSFFLKVKDIELKEVENKLIPEADNKSPKKKKNKKIKNKNKKDLKQKEDDDLDII